MNPIYYHLDELLAMINEPNGSKCRNIWVYNTAIFNKAKGSATKHQAWEGGYLDHITEIMNIAVVMYKAFDACRSLPFSLSDALLTLYLHDLEKPWKYGGPDKHFASDEERHAFVNSLIKKHKIELTDEHRNALKYVHGEGDDWDPHIIKQGPLGAFIHHCDNTSARIWPLEPKKRGRW